MPTPSDRILKLRVSADGNARLKITCENSRSILDPPQYFVHRTQLEEAGRRCREILGNMATMFVANPSPDYRSLMSKLANEGSNLFYLLFDNVAEGLEEADEVQGWLADRKVSTEIIVSVDSECHLPWGLVYDGDPTTANTPATIDNYVGFWGLRYSLSVLFNGMGRFNLDSPRGRSNFRLLFVIDEQEFAQVSSHLSETELAYLRHLTQRPVGRPTHSWDDARDMWIPIIGQDSLVYVFCHAEGTKLILNADAERCEMEVTEFTRRFSKRTRDRERAVGTVSLCFLNGCSTADGLRDNAFRTATSGAGFCGFIGTEAPVPAEFALRFSIAFLYYLLEKGWRVQKIMDTLRVQHWPLSLAYANSAHPHFHVEEDAATAATAPFDDQHNFSLQKFAYARTR